MQDTTLPHSSVARLQEAAQHAPMRTSHRLSEVHALFAAELRALERNLQRVTADGVAPATHAAAHLLAGGGKRIRPLTVLLSAACFGPIDATARELALIAELVHLATLLHDDVLDECQIRRGRAAARCVWGNSVSVLAGDLLLTHALERAALLKPSQLLSLLLSTLRRLVDGEIKQLCGRTTLDMTEQSYFEVVHGKTASLFEWAARAGACAGQAEPFESDALAAFGRHVGVAFQLMDDALDYAGEVEQTGKAIFTDLEEGKVTLPLIIAAQRQPSLIRDIERLRDGDHSVAMRIAAAVQALDACSSVRALARDETTHALTALATLKPSPARELLRTIACELTDRVS